MPPGDHKNGAGATHHVNGIKCRANELFMFNILIYDFKACVGDNIVNVCVHLHFSPVFKMDTIF